MIQRCRKLLDFENGGSIYVAKEDGFLPVNITKEDAIKELKKILSTEKQTIAFFILISWS